MTRNEAREILMQILFEMDLARTMDIETAERLSQDRLTGNHKERGLKLLTGIINSLDDIDGEINKNSRSWKTGRMAKVDLAIIRLAVGEIRFDESIPEAVSINEAVNLAKKFSMDKSAKFINGVLGAIVNSNEQ